MFIGFQPPWIGGAGFQTWQWEIPELAMEVFFAWENHPAKWMVFQQATFDCRMIYIYIHMYTYMYTIYMYTYIHVYIYNYIYIRFGEQ